MTARVTLYTRKDCCLCDEMKSALRAVAAELPVEVEEIDVDRSAELRERYGHEVPVLAIGGRKAFKYRATVQELKERLGRELRARNDD